MFRKERMPISIQRAKLVAAENRVSIRNYGEEEPSPAHEGHDIPEAKKETLPAQWAMSSNSIAWPSQREVGQKENPRASVFRPWKLSSAMCSAFDVPYVSRVFGVRTT